jgi:transcriptional regulator with XRE-family HTH domain
LRLDVLDEEGGPLMAITPEPFGPRLRALRVEKGLSLSEFARRLYYSKGHVSRIETGAAQPSVEFARRCDTELDADGELAALVCDTRSAQATGPEPDRDDDEVWIMTMAPDGTSSLMPLGRRDVLVCGAASLVGLAGRAAAPPTRVTKGAHLDYHVRLLATARELGQVSPPEVVLPMLTGQAQALRLLARESRGEDARTVARLASRTAEFAGWMAQESGDNQLAMWWTRRAARVAVAVGDAHTAMYALVRQALVTLYEGNAAETVALAQRAQATPGTPHRILGLAAQREAQGHALAGNHTDCLRALDVARSHLAAAAVEQSSMPVIGTSHVPDPVAAVTGWCLYDLGRPAAAAAMLDTETARIAPTAVRARLRFGIRQALAHAAAGEVDHACTLAQGLLGQSAVIGSATLRADLRRLAATLRRFPSSPAVRALSPALAAVLHPGR